MSEETKNNEEKINDILDLVGEKFKELADDKWSKFTEIANKLMFIGYLATIKEDELCEFLESKGWELDDLEVKADNLMESIVPEL